MSERWETIWAGCGAFHTTSIIPFPYILQEAGDKRRLLLCVDESGVLASEAAPRDALLFDNTSLESTQPELTADLQLVTALGGTLKLRKFDADRSTRNILTALSVEFQRQENKIAKLIDDVNSRIVKVNDKLHEFARVLNT